MGRETIRAALRQIMARAHSSGLVDARPADLAEQFGTLLWGNMMVGLLLGVEDRPTPREMAARAHAATETFLQLHPRANAATGHRGRR